MKPRQAFGLSFLVALSLHALILFVPRIAGQRDPGPPTMELMLESAQAAGAGPAAEQAGAMKTPAAARAAPPAALPTDPAHAQAPASAAPSEKSEASLLPPSTEPAAGSSGANDQAQASAGSGAGAAARIGGPEGGVGAPGEATPGASGSTTLAPRPRGEILPVYPRSAKRARWQGVVTIRAFIDETGRVVSAVVLTSSGNESLDLSALEAVKSARFDPAVRDARPVSSPLLIPIRFQLN